MSDYENRMADPAPRVLKVTSPVPNGMTVSQIVQWCADNGLTTDEVWMPTGHLCHNHTETPDEVALRLERHKAMTERHRLWVKERYEALFCTSDNEEKA